MQGLNRAGALDDSASFDLSSRPRLTNKSLHDMAKGFIKAGLYSAAKNQVINKDVYSTV